MSCTLRAGGVNFDVDAYLKGSDLKPCAVFRRDDRPAPALQADEPVQQVAGFNVAVSDANFGDLARQTDDALYFVKKNAEELKRLVAYPGIEGVELDFAAEMNDAMSQSYVFSPELLSQLGAMGIELCVSFFTTEPEDFES